jgi:hypothetical protein
MLGGRDSQNCPEWTPGWNQFLQNDIFDRFLRLNWVAVNRPVLAVLLHLAEWHVRNGLGRANAADILAIRISGLLAPYLGSNVNERAIRMAVAELLTAQFLQVHRSGFRGRIMWLQWPELESKLQPTLSVPPVMLELNWVAGSKAELAVLWDLKQSYEQHDPDKCVKLSCRELEFKYRPLLGNDANYRSISRAIHRLNAKGLIEVTTPGPKAAQHMRINMSAVNVELEALRAFPLRTLWS